MVLSVIKWAYAASLLLGPGGLLAYSRFGLGLSGTLAIAAAVVLSPLVIALELAVASIAGMPFDSFVHFVLPLNLIGFLPLIPASRRLEMRPGLLPAIAGAMLLLVPIAALLLSIPHLREYGWHNMMQIASIQPMYRLPAMPEDFDFAGYRLNYPWLGLAQLAATSWVTDRPATILFPIMNAVQFMAMFVFLVAATRRLGVHSAWIAALATAAVLLMPGLLDIAGAVMSPQHLPHGELRITPMSSKFLVIDAMVLGMSAFAMLIHATTCSLETRDAAAVRLVPVASLACGIGYPLLFPSCLVVVALLCICLLARARLTSLWVSRLRLPVYDWRDFLFLAGGMIVVTAVVGGYIAALGTSSARVPMHLVARWQIRRHAIQIVLVFGIIMLALLPFLPAWLRERNMRRLVPIGMFGALLGCFLVISLPITAEYKFLFAGLFAVTPTLASTLAGIPLSGTGRIAGLALLLVIGEAGSGWALWHWHIPRERLGEGVALDETTRFLHPLRGWQGSWMQAVHEATPPDTVVLTGNTVLPIPVFVDRALYVVADWTGLKRPGGGPIGRVGYSMNRTMILEDVKGYPTTEITQRVKVLTDSLAADTSPQTLKECLKALAELHRPVAVHFAAPAALAVMLQQQHLGRVIFRHGQESVWLLQPGELASFTDATRLSARESGAWAGR